MAATADLIDGLRADLETGAVTLDEAVIRLADDGRFGEVAALIAERLAFDPAPVARGLMARWHETAAMLCRTAGLSANGYSAVLRMRRREGRTLDAAPATLLASYLQRPRSTREELEEMVRAYGGRTATSDN